MLKFGSVILLSVAAIAGIRPGAPSSPQPIAGGRFEASGVAGIRGTTAALFIDDSRPHEVFWMQLNRDGQQEGSAVPLPLGVDIFDPEDIATDGTSFYVVSSLSKESMHAADLVRFTIDVETKRVRHVQTLRGLRAQVNRALSELQGVGVLDVEGLAWDPRSKRLLVGFRSPVKGADALVIPLQLRDGGDAAEMQATVGDAIHLTLGGAGIRGLGFDDRAQQFLVIAGATDSGGAIPFRVLEWEGPSSPKTLELTRFAADLKPEGISSISLGGRTAKLIVFDTGHYLVTD
jgi:hypothetical protein